MAATGLRRMLKSQSEDQLLLHQSILPSAGEAKDPYPKAVHQYGKSSRGTSSGKWTKVFRRDLWINEIAALLLSVIVVVAIAVLLAWSSNQTVDAWKLPITLNALLSLLVTILYYPIVTVVSNCVHQLRWLHFYTMHRLYEFESLSKVTKGGVEALSVLWSRHSGWPFRFTAVLMIATAAIGPFTQQILSFGSSPLMIATNASLPASTALDSFDGAALNSRLYAGLYTPTVTSFDVVPQCYSGNCTWSNYTTFAARSRITNITDQLVFASADNLTRWLDTSAFNSSSSDDILNTHFLRTSNSGSGITFGMLQDALSQGKDQNITDGLIDQHSGSFEAVSLNFTLYSFQPRNQYLYDMSWTYTDESVLTSDIYYAVFYVNATRASSSWGNITIVYNTALAWELSFDIVLQQFEGGQRNGIFVETPVGDPVPYNGPNCSVTDTAGPGCALDSTLNGTQYRADTSVLNKISSRMVSLLQANRIFGRTVSTVSLPPSRINSANNLISSTSSDVYLLQVITNQTGNSQLVASTQPGVYPYDVFAGPPSNFTFSNVMDNIARSMTLWMRTTQGHDVLGQVYETKVVYVVQWGWISVPAVLIFLTTCLLAYTIWETRQKGVPVWTDSVLAVLAHGLDDGLRADLASLRTVEELEKASRGVNVVLGKDFVLKTELS